MDADIKRKRLKENTIEEVMRMKGIDMKKALQLHH
jgi:hypothetical protein